MEYNKKIFALLLDKARGERSWRRYALDCDISYVQMRKLAFAEQDNPPRKKLLQKLGERAENGITTDDFLSAAGANHATPLSPKQMQFAASYALLKPKSQKQLEDFAAFLLSKND